MTVGSFGWIQRRLLLCSSLMNLLESFLSVVGRQGKSFILNQLLGRSSGFQVAATYRPCTKGLWSWSAPIKRTALDGGRTMASELGQFSPIFVWLLRDFYLDLVEDNRKITPRDYLEIALRPVQGSAKVMPAKNEIRDSIRALFPDRECFTLVKPVNNEKELQRLEQLPLGKLRSEFSAGLDSLTKFVFERTRLKQIGATVMTSPILVGII